jgi:hypothetical protein
MTTQAKKISHEICLRHLECEMDRHCGFHKDPLSRILSAGGSFVAADAVLENVLDQIES